MVKENSPIIVIPANTLKGTGAGVFTCASNIQKSTGYRIKSGMTNDLVFVTSYVNERFHGVVINVIPALFFFVIPANAGIQCVGYE